MAMKLTIQEICPRCGRVAAQQNEDGTVYIDGHNCTVKVPGSSGEGIFVSKHEPLTDDELNELEQWGTRVLQPFHLSRAKALRIVDTIKTLQDKNKQLSSDFNAMTKDCVKLQKILLDIGFKVNDILGVEISKDVSGFRKDSWQCTCDMWNYPARDSCINCGRFKQC